MAARKPATSVADDLAKESDVQSEVRRRTANLSSELKAQVALVEELRSRLGLYERIEGARLAPPRWLTPARGKKAPGVACVTLTDTHFDEVVRPEEMFDYNAYDRRIAELRLRRWADKTVSLARDHVVGTEYAGLTIFHGGDLFSGVIHEELVETNEDTLYGSFLYWIEQVVAAIRQLADHFGHVHNAVTYGNHGRRTKKPVAKRRAKDNIEYLFWGVVARELRADKRITWDIPESMDTFLTVLNTRYQLTHGDQFRGGSGISGVLTPLMLGASRKARKGLAMGTPFDVLVLGHFHQRLAVPGIIIGGCSKGYDEFAASMNLVPEPPSQSFWITDPQWGITVQAPIHVGDRASEGW